MVDFRDQYGELTFSSPGYLWLQAQAYLFCFHDSGLCRTERGRTRAMALGVDLRLTPRSAGPPSAFGAG